MKKNNIVLSGIVLAIISSSPAYSWAADDASNKSEVEQLRRQLGDLNQRYESQGAALQAISARLQQLEASDRARTNAPRAVKTVATTGDTTQSSGEASQSSSEAQAATQDSNEQVIKEAPASKSAEAVYREQGALFNQTFTLETGLTYSHSDRRDLIVNGFLALDAIFLGNINLDRVRSDIWQFDVTARYGMTDRLQFDFNAPFLYRTSTFQSGGVGGSASALSDEDVNESGIGDVSAGVYYRLFKETAELPDIVWNLRVKAPTGKDPYGIKIVPTSNNNLTIPNDLPTGNGVWTLSSGLTFVKTVDPAILFASASYAHNFTRKFDDISSVPGSSVSGEIDLGDSIQVGGGVAFALNDRMSVSTSYAHRFTQDSRVDGTRIIGSSANSGLLSFGVTYAMTNKLSMVGSVGLGVTPDAPDVTVGIKFPYNF